MRNRFLVSGLVVLLLLVSSSAVWAAKLEITYDVLVREVPGQATYRDLEVKTPLADYILSEQGGTLKSALLNFLPYGSTLQELVPGATTNPKTLTRQYTADAVFPFTLSTSAGDATDGLYQLVGPTVDPETGVFRAEFQGKFAGMAVRKIYTISPKSLYTVDVSVVLENPGRPVDVRLTVANYVVRAKDPLEVHYLFDGEPGQLELAKGSYTSFGGAGLMNKNVVFFLSPKGSQATTPFLVRMPSGSDHFGVSWTAGSGTTKFDGSLYGGRRRFLLMQQAGIDALDKPGVGARLMIPVIQFLDILYRATGNYGWAIILVTILLRVLLYPLMQKQIHSMAKMQELGPKMKQLQERYKDDKQAQQERLMELYRKEKINPLSGCLPMLIQLPIIWLIWRAILLAGEQIHLSPGFLWMPDLSLHDPYFILVILTTAVMLLQQWMMTPPAQPESSPGAKWMGYIFPIVMAFLLWKFPAGLWLYYLLTTAVQVGQQELVNRQMKRARKLAPAADTSGELPGDGKGGGDGATWTS